MYADFWGLQSFTKAGNTYAVLSLNKYMMPFSMAFGAFFLLAADTIAKISGANGLPVGVISSLVGGPMFVYILIKRGKKVWS